MNRVVALVYGVACYVMWTPFCTGSSPEFVGELNGYWWFAVRFFKAWEDRKNTVISFGL